MMLPLSCQTGTASAGLGNDLTEHKRFTISDLALLEVDVSKLWLHEAQVMYYFSLTSVYAWELVMDSSPSFHHLRCHQQWHCLSDHYHLPSHPQQSWDSKLPPLLFLCLCNNIDSRQAQKGITTLKVKVAVSVMKSVCVMIQVCCWYQFATQDSVDLLKW